MPVSIEKAEEVWNMVNEQGMTVEEVAQVRGVVRKTIVDYLSKYERMAVNEVDLPVNLEEPTAPTEEAEMDYEELELEYERLQDAFGREMKSKQKLMDSNRILRKQYREDYRVENAIEEYSKELIEINRKYGEKLSSIKVPVFDKNVLSDRVGVVQLSDLHANEIIDLPHNKFDFIILSKRLKKFADTAIATFEAQGINTILIAMTGDLLNSDRRLDELLNQCVNRSKATILLQHLLTQFIVHLRQHFKVNITAVMGNESRVGFEWGSSDVACSDNYDFTVSANLKQKFEFANIEDITFGNIDKVEDVVNVNGQKWLLTHDCARFTDSQVKSQSRIGAYYLRGEYVDYMIGGHIHCTRISDFASRSASMAGSNEYNETKMGLISRASQNLYSVGKKDRIAMAIDLQDTEGVEGYPIISELEAYNAKSLAKTKDKKAILSIVI